MKYMRHYWFEDGETNEEFIVCADNKEEAYTIARQYFNRVKCYGEISEEEAEASGLDEY